MQIQHLNAGLNPRFKSAVPHLNRGFNPRFWKAGLEGLGCGHIFAMHDANQLFRWPEEAWPVCGRRGCFQKAGRLSA